MMNNKQVAQVLEEIADMLEIIGEVRFKIQAYERAANQIRSMAEDVNGYAQTGKLEDIPGIGKGISARLEELINTGHMQYYEELKEQVPPSVLQLMEIPGVGPKKAKLFYDNLSILSVDELYAAAERHQLQTLPGISDKTEAKIIEGINELRQHRERALLFEALPIAEEIVAELRDNDFVKQADYAGSLRRMLETIGDIDILVSSDHPAEVTKAFCSHKMVSKVLAQGDTKCSIQAKGGLQIDLRVIKPESYGAALLYFTGSKQHNIHIREIAKQRGYKLSEYALEDSRNGEVVAARTENEVFEALGLRFIPPELREDRGEIDASANGTLPDLINTGDIQGDLHVHSDYSDGISSLREIIEYARHLGYRYIAIADHAEKLKVAHGLDLERLRERAALIRKLNDEYSDFDILSGIELNIDNAGNVDYGNVVLREFDVTIASIHGGFNQSREQITDRIVKAMANPFVNIIGHPTGRILGRRFPYEVDIPAILREAARTNTAMELNSYPDRLDLDSEHLRKAKELGVKIAINTDAHVDEQMRYITYGIATARRGWLEKKDVINTLAVDDLRKTISKV